MTHLKDIGNIIHNNIIHHWDSPVECVLFGSSSSGKTQIITRIFNSDGHLRQSEIALSIAAGAHSADNGSTPLSDENSDLSIGDISEKR